MTNGVPKEV